MNETKNAKQANIKQIRFKFASIASKQIHFLSEWTFKKSQISLDF
jgi:hypothetical protein